MTVEERARKKLDEWAAAGIVAKQDARWWVVKGERYIQAIAEWSPGPEGHLGDYMAMKTHGCTTFEEVAVFELLGRMVAAGHILGPTEPNSDAPGERYYIGPDNKPTLTPPPAPPAPKVVQVMNGVAGTLFILREDGKVFMATDGGTWMHVKAVLEAEERLHRPCEFHLPDHRSEAERVRQPRAAEAVQVRWCLQPVPVVEGPMSDYRDMVDTGACFECGENCNVAVLETARVQLCHICLSKSRDAIEGKAVTRNATCTCGGIGIRCSYCWSQREQ